VTFVKPMKPSTRAAIWRTSLCYFLMFSSIIAGAVFSIPEWDPGYFYLFEGQVRAFAPLAAVAFVVFVVFLVHDLRLSRKEMAERERYYEQRAREREQHKEQ
jgi:hypothetical protein